MENVTKIYKLLYTADVLIIIWWLKFNCWQPYFSLLLILTKYFACLKCYTEMTAVYLKNDQRMFKMTAWCFKQSSYNFHWLKSKFSFFEWNLNGLNGLLKFADDGLILIGRIIYLDDGWFIYKFIIFFSLFLVLFHRFIRRTIYKF